MGVIKGHTDAEVEYGIALFNGTGVAKNEAAAAEYFLKAAKKGSAPGQTRLALMYATDFFDQMEHRILPALRSGTIVLADRFIFTLIARGVVRGINRDYMSGLYAMALRPHLTFWLNVRPETAFGREFKKAQAISYWEAGRDMSLSHDLYWSFIRYQTMIKREFEVMAKKHSFLELDGEANVPAVNKQLRQRIGEQLGIRATKYMPSSALAHLWR